jgi:hypothetical protein
VTELFRVRLLRGALAAALVVMAGHGISTARAQEEPPPLEDVTLRGRILRPDGRPLANTAVRVDAVKDDGFAMFSFFFTFGFSSFTCFDPSNDLCPIPNSERYNSTTDTNGNYSFTFPDAHRQGEQTNTDYYLSVAMPSKVGGDKAAIASYELELWDAVHDAPDLVLWDPSAKVTARERGYSLAFDRRPDSKNKHTALIGKQKFADASSDSGVVDARAIEDANVTLVPNASKDVKGGRTIYHQRFDGAPVALKGTQVPLSRRASCTATRKDGSLAARCGFTDGDLITPGVVDANPCIYFPNGEKAGSYRDVASGQEVPCQEPVTTVTIDLGAAKEVGEVRSRCGCTLAASSDGRSWSEVPNRELGAPQSMRYLRATGSSLGHTPEISVWAPWPDNVAATPLATTTTIAAEAPNVAAPSSPTTATPDDGDRPWLLAGVALAALAAVAYQLGKARRQAA